MPKQCMTPKNIYEHADYYFLCLRGSQMAGGTHRREISGEPPTHQWLHTFEASLPQPEHEKDVRHEVTGLGCQQEGRWGPGCGRTLAWAKRMGGLRIGDLRLGSRVIFGSLRMHFWTNFGVPGYCNVFWNLLLMQVKGVFRSRNNLLGLFWDRILADGIWFVVVFGVGSNK